MRWRALVVSILLLATALLAAIARPTPATALVAADPQLRVLAVRSGSDGQVSLVGQLAPTSPAPLGPVTATVTSGGRNRPAVGSRLLSDRTAVALVVDTSADATASLQAGGRSGTASFLLQLPPNARTAVVADRRPPVLAAPASVGVAQALRATSALPAGGQRATSDALTLALRQVPAEPGGQRLIVLYTNAPDAAGESASALGRRLRQANAVLAVVVTAARAQYWQQVAGATGGLAIATRADRAIDAFDALADELRSRFTVIFPRADGARQA